MRKHDRDEYDVAALFEPGTLRLEQAEAISFRRYSDGSLRATWSHWDSASNKMVFESLSDPRPPMNGAHGAAYALWQAAWEHGVDVGLFTGTE